MTLDMHPKGWRRVARLFLLWLALPEEQAERLIDVLPEREQDKFYAFLLMKQTPQKALKDLETHAKRGHPEAIGVLIDHLPRKELEKLVRAGLKRGKLIDNISQLSVQELREVVLLCSYPKDFFVHLVFDLLHIDT